MKRPPLFERLKKGLEDALTHERGEITLKQIVVDLPEIHFEPKEIARLRHTLRVSQGVFARMLRVSVQLVQKWEQGERTPSGSPATLLELLRRKPEESHA